MGPAFCRQCAHIVLCDVCVCVCVRALIEDVSCAYITGEPATLFLDVFVVKGLTIAFITFQASYKFQLGGTFLNVTEGIASFIHIFLVHFFFYCAHMKVSQHGQFCLYKSCWCEAL